MRKFHFKGPFGLQFTLATSVPGIVSITYSNHAKSELATEAAPQAPDQSEISIKIPIAYDVADPNAARRLALPGSRVPRGELAQATIVEDIQRKGIKVRDFAYEPPVKQATEIFNPENALCDYEYALSNEPRTAAVAGKTLRRLLDIGWVKMKDAKERWHKMDWDSLAAHDKRPAYPWRPLKVPEPSEEQRVSLLRAREPLYFAITRAQREEELFHQFEAQRLAAQKRVYFLPIDAAMDPPESVAPNEKKRRFSDDSAEAEDSSASTPDSKRPCLGLPLTTVTAPPLKQFPAPREAYDLEIHDFIDSAMAPPASDSTCLAPTTPPHSHLRQKKPISRTRTFAYL